MIRDNRITGNELKTLIASDSQQVAEILIDSPTVDVLGCLESLAFLPFLEDISESRVRSIVHLINEANELLPEITEFIETVNKNLNKGDEDSALIFKTINSCLSNGEQFINAMKLNRHDRSAILAAVCHIGFAKATTLLQETPKNEKIYFEQAIYFGALEGLFLGIKTYPALFVARPNEWSPALSEHISLLFNSGMNLESGLKAVAQMFGGKSILGFRQSFIEVDLSKDK